MRLPDNIVAERNTLIEHYIKSSTGVLHLGAHKGQEAPRYHKLEKPVVWVEAIPDIFAVLKQNVSSYPDQKALCALLADVDGKQFEFNISNNWEGVSSSIFEFGEYGSGKKSLWPELGLDMEKCITLPSLTLDSLLKANDINPRSYDYWVVDLQGAELLALKGAFQSLVHCKAIYIEVSNVEVYKGAVLWDELKSELMGLGFSPLWDIQIDHDDVLFIKK